MPGLRGIAQGRRHRRRHHQCRRSWRRCSWRSWLLLVSWVSVWLANALAVEALAFVAVWCFNLPRHFRNFKGIFEATQNKWRRHWRLSRTVLRPSSLVPMQSFWLNAGSLVSLFFLLRRRRTPSLLLRLLRIANKRDNLSHNLNRIE